jgi:hypothetical protein
MASEREVQNSILLATARSALLFRSNAGKWFNVPNPCPACALKGRWIQGMPAGAPDLIGLVRGSGAALAVECKSPTGRQRAEQVDFEAAWVKAGGIYVLARSATEALEQVRRHTGPS